MYISTLNGLDGTLPLLFPGLKAMATSLNIPLIEKGHSFDTPL